MVDQLKINKPYNMLWPLAFEVVERYIQENSLRVKRDAPHMFLFSYEEDVVEESSKSDKKVLLGASTFYVSCKKNTKSYTFNIRYGQW